MSRTRARYRCKVCKKPSTTAMHPSCAKRQRAARTRKASTAINVVAHPRRATRRKARQLRRRAGRAVLSGIVNGPARVGEKARQHLWVRSVETHHVQSKAQAARRVTVDRSGVVIRR